MGGRANSANPFRGASLSESWRSRSILMPLLVVVVVLAEISFLGRLNMARNADIVHTWTESFYSSSSSSPSSSSSSSFPPLGIDELGKETCREWLEREDAVLYSRNFEDDPIWVWGGQKEYKPCSVGCTFEGQSKEGKKPDAAFGMHPNVSLFNILRSMESSHYYSDNKIDHARRTCKTRRMIGGGREQGGVYILSTHVNTTTTIVSLNSTLSHLNSILVAPRLGSSFSIEVALSSS